MTGISSYFSSNQFKALMRIEVVCLVALSLAAIVIGGFEYLQIVFTGESIFSAVKSAFVIFVYTIFLGIGPTVLFGAPIYAVLRAYSHDHWGQVLMAGLTPGIILLFFELSIGIYGCVCGTIISSLTHIYFRHKAIAGLGNR